MQYIKCALYCVSPVDLTIFFPQIVFFIILYINILNYMHIIRRANRFSIQLKVITILLPESICTNLPAQTESSVVSPAQSASSATGIIRI